MPMWEYMRVDYVSIHSRSDRIGILRINGKQVKLPKFDIYQDKWKYLYHQSAEGWELISDDPGTWTFRRLTQR